MNVKVEKINHLARYRSIFKDAHIEKLIEKLEPEYILNFELHNVDTSIANGIRRCALAETMNIN